MLVCTASNKAYAPALDFLRFDGTLVCIGMPEGAPQPIAKSFPQQLVFKQANISAVAVGNRRDAIECLDFAARGIVKTHFRTEKMEKLTEVSGEMILALLGGSLNAITAGVPGDEGGETHRSSGLGFAVDIDTVPIPFCLTSIFFSRSECCEWEMPDIVYLPVDTSHRSHMSSPQRDTIGPSIFHHFVS